jgi:hypothetical protein
MKFDLLSLKNKAISMKLFKHIAFLIFLMSLLSNCSSAQKLQEKAPMGYGEVYCEKWVSGVQGGGSGINIFIPISNELPNSIQLDSVYFRGKGSKLEIIKGENTLYVGRFKTSFNQGQDMVMSSDPNDEYGNPVPILKEKIPFVLQDSECVISYKEGSDTKYFRIENIIEKQPQHYPSAPKGQ